jgi:TRAP-type C4-dicarboxylate transport system permease small subunit
MTRIKHICLLIYNNVEGFLIVIFTLMLVADVLAGIAARYVRFEIVFASELGKYIFIWLCAIGISAAARDNQHVRINFVVERLPVSRKLSWIVSQVLFLAFSLLFFYIGCRLTWMHFIMHKSAMGFSFPMYLFTAALPAGFALTSVRLVNDILKKLKIPTASFSSALEPAGITEVNKDMEINASVNNKPK